jgi:hypothetical protein
MSFFDDPPLRDFPDHAMRRMLEDPANLRDLVGAALPQLVDRLDFNRVEYEPREFLMEDWRQRECDLFVRVPFRTGPESAHVLVCVLVEHQSSPDPRLPCGRWSTPSATGSGSGRRGSSDTITDSPCS